MKCQRCQREITAEDSFTHLGQTLCEDCYLDIRNPTRTCDPWAVYAATRARESAGLTGVEGLTSLQQAIYAFVKNRGRTSAAEIMTKFNLTPSDFQSELSVLRHCELLKGQKEGDKVVIVPFR
jgi:hypothetical protein